MHFLQILKYPGNTYFSQIMNFALYLQQAFKKLKYLKNNLKKFLMFSNKLAVSESCSQPLFLNLIISLNQNLCKIKLSVFLASTFLKQT